MRSFCIELQGHRYQAVWTPQSDGSIKVESSYGSRRVDLDGAEPGLVARKVLETILATQRPLR